MCINDVVQYPLGVFDTVAVANSEYHINPADTFMGDVFDGIAPYFTVRNNHDLVVKSLDCGADQAHMAHFAGNATGLDKVADVKRL